MTKRLGVRELVEFVLRQGDLMPTSNSSNTAQLGSRIHRQLQKDRGPNYEKEVYFKRLVSMDRQDYQIDGRADGISNIDGHYTIEEIKTSDTPFESLTPAVLARYWGQVQCYGYFLCEEQDLEKVDLTLMYFQTDTNELTPTTKTMRHDELAEFFNKLIAEYESWLVFKSDLVAKRDASLKQLQFPFGGYRTGQRELAVAVYKSIVLKKRLLVEAPTGTGKTMSTLFPALKAMGEGHYQRLFYLTAKQSTRHVAEEALALLDQQQLAVKSITLTAKDQIKFADEPDDPSVNPYMLGYYDRLGPAVKDLLLHENLITKTVVETYARKHTLDPFEFSLDASLFCDVIIGDYNYLFDPIVYLQRFFAAADENNFFLLDEAHNMVSRSREMYSAEISNAPISHLKKLLSEHHTTSDQQFKRQLTKLNKAFLELAASQPATAEPLVQREALESLNLALDHFVEKNADWLQQHPGKTPLNDAILDYYFACLRYLKIADDYSEETYRTLLQNHAEQVGVKQLCLDPSAFLDACLDKGRGAIFFSATLSPLNYYQDVLGAGEDSLRYQLPSPFPSENQAIFVADYVQTTYQQRSKSLGQVIASLTSFVNAHRGHYLFFFPSFSYLEAVAAAFSTVSPDIPIYQQTNSMSAEQRQDFLQHFNENVPTTLVGFAVLGGIFGEGIDLVGEKLIGIAVISVGLPGLSLENNLLRDYFNAKNGQGFQYAYQLPGFNNVQQAVGRLIRTERDRGTILLLDRRFAESRYRHFFPEHWQQVSVVSNLDELGAGLRNFWQV